MFFSDTLRVPHLVGPVKLVKGASMTKKENEQFPPGEAQRRFEEALRGARVVGHKPMKELARRPAKPAQKKPRKKATAST